MAEKYPKCKGRRRAIVFERPRGSRCWTVAYRWLGGNYLPAVFSGTPEGLEMAARLATSLARLGKDVAVREVELPA